jgi:hypothetical protein
MALADGRTDLALERMQEAETLFAEFGGAPDSHKFAFGPLRIQLLVQAGRLDEARQELQRIEALPDSDAVRRQRLRGALYLALASGEDSQAEILRDTYAAEVAQLGPGDYLGPYRLAGIDRLLGGT